MAVSRNGDDVIYAGRKRMWEFQAEVHRLTAYSADSLRGIYFLLVGFKLRSLSAVVIGTKIRFRHAPTSLNLGIKIALAADIYVGRKCCFDVICLYLLLFGYKKTAHY